VENDYTHYNIYIKLQNNHATGNKIAQNTAVLCIKQDTGHTTVLHQLGLHTLSVVGTTQAHHLHRCHCDYYNCELLLHKRISYYYAISFSGGITVSKILTVNTECMPN